MKEKMSAARQGSRAKIELLIPVWCCGNPEKEPDSNTEKCQAGDLQRETVFLHEDDRKRLKGKVLKAQKKCVPERSFTNNGEKEGYSTLYQTSIRRAMRSQRMSSGANMSHMPQEIRGKDLRNGL